MNDLHGVQTLLYRVDDYVRQCHPPWTNSWGVSFFTDERFAGFLRDEAGKHFLKKESGSKPISGSIPVRYEPYIDFHG